MVRSVGDWLFFGGIGRVYCRVLRSDWPGFNIHHTHCALETEMHNAAVDDYFARLSPPQRAALSRLRTLILAAAPNAEECIAYGIPTFKLNGTAIAGIAAFKHHCSYFPYSGRVVELLAGELGSFSTNKGTIRFTLDAPLPAALVRKLVRTRIKVIAEKSRSKK